ncbi:hypothetical protein P280DRAFT_480990 [Massarina eburnea CBS 473.64]|uniref:Glycoside hydrolase n=1 Tax=Massarina eburnea CBS 473.64 TaxID=1395130 RepID=A0A6A6RXQ2_9PLEO|nr:hypothetical protein P280DRAFT_480990 [Massarina eburnea CBS 473.64]
MPSYASWLALGLLTAVSRAAPLVERATNKLVFAHFMMGTQSARTSSKDYDTDMQQAKAAGIDAFALNIGLDSYTETQLNYAYQSAADNGMKVFISFDYNYYTTGSESAVATLIKKYSSSAGQLNVDSKPFVSTFNGNQETAKTLDAPALKSAAGDIFLVPNYQPKKDGADMSLDGIDGAFNWMAWPNNGANRAPTASVNLTVENGDTDYTNWLGTKNYMAPISPWFFTDFDQYDKHWVFPADLLWFNRWNNILSLAPRFVEIITWNDFGESHNVADLPSGSTVDGAAWSADQPHSGWLEMALPYIAAFKAGDKTPTITEEKLVYWYRPSKVADCSKAIEGKESLQDAVFVVALLKSAGTVTVTSGSTTQTFEAKAGAQAFQVPMAYGKQTFKLTRSGADVFSSTGSKEIAASNCPVASTNLNAIVGVAKGSVAVDSPSSAPASSAAPSSSAVASASSSIIKTLPPTTAPSATATNSTTVPKVSSSAAVATSASAPVPTTLSSVQYTATTKATSTTAGSGQCVTITASEQIRPTNCLASGQHWAGPGDTPSPCDGATTC